MMKESFIRRLVKEEIIDKVQLCDLNLKELLNHYDSKLFGDFQERIDKNSFDEKISKSLCLGDKIIGGYLLNKSDMIEQIKWIQWHINNTEGFKNLKFFVNKDFLKRYKDKRGIASEFIYIDKNYSGNNYAKILIDYSKTLGDYVFGFSVPNVSEEYWLEKQGRVKVLEYEDSIGKVTLSVTKI